MRLKYLIPLLLVLLLAFFVRFFQVGTHPIGVSIDEASFGYNAWSILETGQDEHGVSYPLIFKAFGDQKLPMYAYMLVPFIGLFGLENITVRLPSVIAGTLIVGLVCLLVLRFGFTKRQSLLVGLIAAVSPWGIILSRFGYESNIGLLFFISGLLSFVVYLKKEQSRYLIGSGLFFALTWYSYIAYRMIIPLVLLAILVLFFRSRKKIKHLLVLVITFSVVVLPLLPTVFSKEGTARFNQIGLFSDPGVVMEVNEDRTHCTQDLPSLVCYTLYNKPTVISRALVERYLQVFSLDYLFINGEVDQKSLSQKHFGLFPIFIFPFFIFGTIYLFAQLAKRKITRLELFCLIGFLLSPIPAVLSGDAQRVRLTPLFPFIFLTIAYGFKVVDLYLKSIRAKSLYTSILVIALVIFSSVFLISYLTSHIKKHEAAYASQIHRLVEYISQQSEDTDIYITSFGYTLYYYLYYQKIPPVESHKFAIWEEPDETGFAHITDYKNMHIVWETIDESFCRSKDGRNAIFITENSNDNLKAIYTLKSYDDVFKLFYVYDKNSVGKLKCVDTNPSVR